MDEVRRQPDDPYCRFCGYLLKGLEDSSKCPECGKPIVDGLVRDEFPGTGGRRYQSKRRLWGLPLVSIAMGPRGPEKIGRPVGVIAIGDVPKGIIAIGGRATGVIAFGGFAMGGLSFGGFSVGIVGLGGFSAGLVALGGFAVGAFAYGGTVVPLIRGAGGRVIHLLSLPGF